MIYTYKKRYKIMSISPDGLLKVPTSPSYGYSDEIFYSYYETERDAEQAIINRDSNETFLILPVMTKLWDIEL
jgi:hypothetical protein